VFGLLEVIGADDELAPRGGEVDQVHVDPGVGDGAEDRPRGARAVLDRTDDHLALGADRLARRLEGLPRGRTIGHDDVQDAFAGAFEPAGPIDVDAGISDGLECVCQCSRSIDQGVREIRGHGGGPPWVLLDERYSRARIKRIANLDARSSPDTVSPT
jgi:hypothetical protein